MPSPSFALPRFLRNRVGRILQSGPFRGAALSLLIQAQLVGLQLVTGIILARALGPAEFGTYSFALALVLLVQVMPNSGLDNAVVRYSAQYNAGRSWTLLRGLWRIAFVASVTYGVLSAMAVFWGCSLGWLPTTAALSPPVVAVAATPMFFLPLMTVVGAALRAVHPGVVGQLPQYVVKPWIYLALIAVIVLTAPQALNAKMAMYAQGGAAFATTLIGVYWLRIYRPGEMSGRRPAYECRRWLRSTWLFSLTAGLMFINTQADVLMLGIMSSAHETGLYKIAATGANLVALSLTAANLYIAPRISAMYAWGERDKLQRILLLSVRTTFAVALMIASAFWFWGGGLIKAVFGAAYVGAYWPLSILCLGQLINVGAGSVGLILNMTGNEDSAAKMTGIAGGCNVALNLVLIPMFSGVGAAVSTTVTMVTWNSLMLMSLRRKTGLTASILGTSTVC